MLSSIHPFGERSRNNSFWQTAAAHVVGSTLGGITLGAAAGVLGWATTLFWEADSIARPALLGSFAAAAALLEATGRERTLPTRTRQVNENWIQTYRGWVYGGGFGAELGFGISTIITTTLVHVMVVAMFLVGSIPLAMAIGAVFGLVRGATILTAWTVDSPDRLRALHRSLDHLRSRSRSGAVASLAVASAVGFSAVML